MHPIRHGFVAQKMHPSLREIDMPVMKHPNRFATARQMTRRSSGVCAAQCHLPGPVTYYRCQAAYRKEKYWARSPRSFLAQPAQPAFD